MSYGSTQAVCTYNAQSANKCVFDDIEYQMGEMCAHQLFAVGQYVVMQCKKIFTDGSRGKVKIYTVQDGMLIGSISTPPIQGYIPAATDHLTVQLMESGLKIAYMINGVGILAECIEYRNNIGFRVSLNAYGTCTGRGTVFSNGQGLFVQDQLDVTMFVPETEIDCGQVYSDSW